MDYNKQKKAILDIAKALDSYKLLSKGDLIAYRVEDSIIVTKEGISLSTLKMEDIDIVSSIINPTSKKMATVLAIFKEKIDANVIIINHAPNCVAVAKHADKIPPVLDDMAQIIGPTAKIAPTDEIIDILKTLKGRNACLIRNQGVVATGRTLDEAFTCSLVLEKGAKAYVDGAVLGGAKLINIVEAYLMHFIYKKKYSKKNQENKLNEAK